MHLESKKMATIGIMLAICILCVYGGTVIESNTLFLLSAASFFVGIIIKEYGMKMGVAFFIASIALSFILVPIKMYTLTLAAMEFYLIMKYLLQDRVGKAYMVVRYVIFNILYIPALIFFPSLIYNGKINLWIMLLLFAGGQVVFTIYEIAYEWALRAWEKGKKRIG